MNNDYIKRSGARRAMLRADAKSVHLIDDIPAADVREVVICGECEFWNREHISCEGLARCNTGETGIRYRNRSDFCSRGKKMEG